MHESMHTSIHTSINTHVYIMNMDHQMSVKSDILKHTLRLIRIEETMSFPLIIVIVKNYEVIAKLNGVNNMNKQAFCCSELPKSVQHHTGSECQF